MKAFKKVFLSKDSGQKGPHLREGKLLKVSKYRVKVQAEIAQGAAGIVYRVKDASDSNSQYALKHIIISSDPEALHPVQTEIRMLELTTGNPHVIQLLATEVKDCGSTLEYFILTELCHETLVSTLERHPTGLGETDALPILQDIVAAVTKLHSLEPPVAHRDLKAENILLGRDGKWKVCDFGSATSRSRCYRTEEEINIEEENIRKHTTPAYRAPEMWDLYRHDLVNEKVDIWALGCLLYRMAFSKSAFDGVDSKLQALNGNILLPEVPRQHHSAALHGLILELLNTRPEKRPDIFAVSARVDELLSGAASSTVFAQSAPAAPGTPLTPAPGTPDVASSPVERLSSNDTAHETPSNLGRGLLGQSPSFKGSDVGGSPTSPMSIKETEVADFTREEGFPEREAGPAAVPSASPKQGHRRKNTGDESLDLLVEEMLSKPQATGNTWTAVFDDPAPVADRPEEKRTEEPASNSTSPSMVADSASRPATATDHPGSTVAEETPSSTPEATPDFKEANPNMEGASTIPAASCAGCGTLREVEGKLLAVQQHLGRVLDQRDALQATVDALQAEVRTQAEQIQLLKDGADSRGGAAAAMDVIPNTNARGAAENAVRASVGHRVGFTEQIIQPQTVSSEWESFSPNKEELQTSEHVPLDTYFNQAVDPLDTPTSMQTDLFSAQSFKKSKSQKAFTSTPLFGGIGPAVGPRARQKTLHAGRPLLDSFSQADSSEDAISPRRLRSQQHPPQPKSRHRRTMTDPNGLSSFDPFDQTLA
ncbi:hypothetical protein CYMTET_4640 [Cymbomonas tetramitiformis]|uniref:non-specific serine/threonine protein kinase n=1 Tax=Cymbomonas tetramitiformis TaxID=36881 RepID=A0AAE0H0Y4_9CHLO|nr:hypothetical protein CYMTET_4640 [Cymbomonas tetramitiformis]